MQPSEQLREKRPAPACRPKRRPPLPSLLGDWPFQNERPLPGMDASPWKPLMVACHRQAEVTRGFMDLRAHGLGGFLDAGSAGIHADHAA